MKGIKSFILTSALLLSVPAFAADITESEIAAEELVHEAQVQAQMQQLQQARDAAFLKQLEAEMQLLEQQAADQGAVLPTADPISPAI